MKERVNKIDIDYQNDYAILKLSNELYLQNISDALILAKTDDKTQFDPYNFKNDIHNPKQTNMQRRSRTTF